MVHLIGACVKHFNFGVAVTLVLHWRSEVCSESETASHDCTFQGTHWWCVQDGDQLKAERRMSMSAEAVAAYEVLLVTGALPLQRWQRLLATSCWRRAGMLRRLAYRRVVFKLSCVVARHVDCVCRHTVVNADEAAQDITWHHCTLLGLMDPPKHPTLHCASPYVMYRLALCPMRGLCEVSISVEISQLLCSLPTCHTTPANAHG